LWFSDCCLRGGRPAFESRSVGGWREALSRARRRPRPLHRQSVLAHRLRALLTALGIAVGVAAVVLLTSIGEGGAPLRGCRIPRSRHQSRQRYARHRRRTMGGPSGCSGPCDPLTIDDSSVASCAVRERIRPDGQRQFRGRRQRTQRRSPSTARARSSPRRSASRWRQGSYLRRTTRARRQPRSARVEDGPGNLRRRNRWARASCVGSERYRVVGTCGRRAR